MSTCLKQHIVSKSIGKQMTTGNDVYGIVRPYPFFFSFLLTQSILYFSWQFVIGLLNKTRCKGLTTAEEGCILASITTVLYKINFATRLCLEFRESVSDLDASSTLWHWDEDTTGRVKTKLLRLAIRCVNWNPSNFTKQISISLGNHFLWEMGREGRGVWMPLWSAPLRKTLS